MIVMVANHTKFNHWTKLGKGTVSADGDITDWLFVVVIVSSKLSINKNARSSHLATV